LGQEWSQPCRQIFDGFPVVEIKRGQPIVVALDRSTSLLVHRPIIGNTPEVVTTMWKRSRADRTSY